MEPKRETRQRKLILVSTLATLVVTAFCSPEVRSGWGDLRQHFIDPAPVYADQLIRPLEAPKPKAGEEKRFDTLWDDMVGLRQEMDRLFQQSFNRFHDRHGLPHAGLDTGGVDIRDDDNRYVVSIDMPGVDKNKINLRIDGSRLKIGAVREELVEEHNAQFARRERRVGHFTRFIDLPGPVRRDGATAKYDNGVLVVQVEKDRSTPAEGQEIKIQ